VQRRLELLDARPRAAHLHAGERQPVEGSLQVGLAGRRQLGRRGAGSSFSLEAASSSAQ